MVYGKGSVVKSGLLTIIEGSLKEAGIACEAFGGAQANPTLAHAEEGVQKALSFGASLAAVWGAWAEELYRDCPQRFAQFARRVWGVEDPDDLSAAKEGVDRTVAFFRSIGMPTTLKELCPDVRTEDLPQLARDATANDTLRLSRIRPLDAQAVEAIYRRAMA